MKKLLFPYGKNQLDYEFNEKELVGVLTSSIEEYTPEAEGYELVEQMHMIPASSLGEAIALGKSILSKDDVTITAIPDGVSVVVI